MGAYDTWLIESPIDAIEGESLTFTITYEGATTCSSPTALAYRNKTSVTATVFPTNTPTASGNVVTLSPLTGMLHGNYVVAVTATVDGNVQVRKFQVRVGRDEDEQ